MFPVAVLKGWADLRQTHCLTEAFFDRALERAKHLDEILEKTGKPLGPLHGLPISLKVRRSHLVGNITH